MNSKEFIQWCHLYKSIDIPSLTVSSKPLIMGVLNVTPDSFSDSGLYVDINQAIQRADEMRVQGADIIDIGGESTKPGSKPISSDEELARIIPVIQRLRSMSDICISIDTYKADVMEAAVDAGATMINDIQALKGPKALETAARLCVPVCLMHMRGVPETMQEHLPDTTDLVSEINLFFEERMAACLNAGIPLEHLIVDPGFGFGKTVDQNLNMVRLSNQFLKHRVPLLLGVSRKSTLGIVLEKGLDERLMGGIAMAVFAVLQGVSIIRTHDVGETYQALKMINAIVQAA